MCEPPPGLGIELLGLETDSERQIVCSLLSTIPTGAIPKPGRHLRSTSALTGSAGVDEL